MNTGGSALFSWVISDGNSHAVLNLRGELDLAAMNATRDKLFEDLERCEGPVVVDATELEFIDSTGIRLLLEIKFKFDKENRSFTLGQASLQVERVLDISGVRPVFEKSNAGKAGHR